VCCFWLGLRVAKLAARCLGKHKDMVSWRCDLDWLMSFKGTRPWSVEVWGPS